MQWAQKYDTDFYELLNSDMEFAKNILSIDRYKKTKKDIAKYSEVKDYTRYFMARFFSSYTLPENISPKDATLILENMWKCDPSDDKTTVCKAKGYLSTT